VMVIMASFLAGPVSAQLFVDFNQDVEDIVDELTSEEELLLYEEHPDFTELEELFYERQAEEVDEDKLVEQVSRSGEFQFKTYKTINSGDNLGVYSKLKTQYGGLTTLVIAGVDVSKSESSDHTSLGNLYMSVSSWDAELVPVNIPVKSSGLDSLLEEAGALGQELGVPINGSAPPAEEKEQKMETVYRLKSLGAVKSDWQVGRRTFRFGRKPSINISKPNLDGKRISTRVNSDPTQKLVSRIGYMSESQLKNMYGFPDEWDWSGGTILKNDGISYQRFFEDTVDIALAYGHIKGHSDDSLVFGGINARSGNYAKTGMGFFNLHSRQFDNEVSGMDFYGYKKFALKKAVEGEYFATLSLYGEFGYFQNLGDGLYGELKTGLGSLPGSKSARTDIVIKLEDTNNKGYDPFLTAPFKFNDRSMSDVSIKYRLSTSSYLMYKVKKVDTDSLTTGSEYQTSRATWSYKPLSRTSFRVYYERYLPDEGNPNSTVYGKINFKVNKKWLISTYLKYRDSDINTAGGGTTYGYLRVFQKISPKSMMNYYFQSKKQTGKEEEYKLTCKWTQKF
ncbi:MAG: hypothetical protein QGH40_04620, partial [bacterium]|nr:hypothetical protein [bacterium]